MLMYELNEFKEMAEKNLSIGDTIQILNSGESSLIGKKGKVTNIDDYGQIYGTWGKQVISYEFGDEFIVIKKGQING